MPIDPIIGGALIGSGVNLVSGLVSGYAQQSANETNVQLARENREWQESMWNKTNEYNTPQKQIERLRAAGLNPALMYSNGQANTANTPTAPAAPHVQPITGFAQGIGNAGDTISNAVIQLEQAKQMRAQTRMMEAKATKEENTTMTPDQYLQYLRTKINATKSQGEYYDARRAGQDMYNIYEPKLLSNQVRSGELSNTRLNMNMWLDIAKLQLDYQNYELRKRMTDSQVNYYYHLCRLAQQKYDVVQNMTPVEMQKLGHEITKMAAETKNIEQRTDYLDDELVLKAIKIATSLMPTPVIMP